MVDARIYKIGIEALAESPIRIGVTKQAVEIIADSSANDAPVRIYKTGMEILRKTPGKLDVTRQTVEVIAEAGQANAAPVQIYKTGIEILVQNLRVMQVTKQAVEIISKNIANSAPAKLIKTGIEILFRSGPILTSPASLPSYWEVFAHNWADDVEMETVYDTDVSIASSNLTEERRSRRDRPYRSITFRWSGLERSAVDRLVIFLRKISSDPFFIPLYQDITPVAQFSESGLGKKTIYCEPAEARFCLNQRIAVVQLGDNLLPINAQVYEIDEIEIDRLIIKSDLTEDCTPGLTYIFPCMDIEIILEPQITFLTNYKANVILQAEEITASTALPPSWTGLPEHVQIHDGIPVFSWEPDWSQNPIVTYKREGTKSELGRGIDIYQKGDRYRMVHNYQLAEARDIFWSYLKFFDSRRGRKNIFWHVDVEDIWKVSNISGVFVEIFEYGDFTEFQEDFNYIGIVTTDGRYFVRDVITIQSILGVYRITVDDALPSLSPEQIKRVTRARLSRYQKDVLKETWKCNQYAIVPIDIIELLNEDLVEMD